jgi:hypothetical protein
MRGVIRGGWFEYKVAPEKAMTDTTTRKPLHVSTDGGAGPYIMVPVSQLDKVTALLDANRVSYWVDEEAISLDGKPEVTVINLGHRGDPVTVQRLLDSIP